VNHRKEIESEGQYSLEGKGKVHEHSVFEEI
jgi:hypothetical protein